LNSRLCDESVFRSCTWSRTRFTPNTCVHGVSTYDYSVKGNRKTCVRRVQHNEVPMYGAFMFIPVPPSSCSSWLKIIQSPRMSGPLTPLSQRLGCLIFRRVCRIRSIFLDISDRFLVPVRLGKCSGFRRGLLHGCTRGYHDNPLHGRSGGNQLKRERLVNMRQPLVPVFHRAAQDAHGSLHSRGDQFCVTDVSRTVASLNSRYAFTFRVV
jgi:hypothetical protein